jgi:hypothetical protein
MSPRVAPVSGGSTREKRRQELVQAAFNLIAEHGFEGLRTRDVAAEVGVNIATLHRNVTQIESPARAPRFVGFFNPLAQRLLGAGVPLGPNALIRSPSSRSEASGG